MRLWVFNKTPQDSVSQSHVSFTMFSESMATKDRMEEGEMGGPRSSCCCQVTEGAAERTGNVDSGKDTDFVISTARFTVVMLANVR